MKKIFHILKFSVVFLLLHNCFSAYAVLGDGNALSVDFNLIVGRYNAITQVFTPLAIGETIALNDIITVRIVPQSDFFVGNTSFVIMFDKVKFTVQGANKAAFTVNSDPAHIDLETMTTLPGYTGNYYYDFACSGYSGATAIPDASWPLSFAAGERYDVYKAIKCVTNADGNSINSGYPELLPGTWLFQFSLKANQNIIVGTNARIWMDTRWYRSDTNPGVAGFIVKCLDGNMSSSGSTTYPFSFDFTDSDIKLALSAPISTSTITFDVAGGTPAIAPITQEEGTPVTAPADPTKAGYTFQGWVPAVPSTMPVDDMTCVAQWTAASTCGVLWTARTAAEANWWNSVTYGNGLFVAVANSETNSVMTSPDGINWTARTAAAASAWYSVTYGNGLFVAVAPDGTNRVMTSPDGISWTARAAAEDNYWRSVTYGNSLFVAVASSGTNRVMTSPDGITWTARTEAAASEWYFVTYGNGLFVAVANLGTNKVMTSPDGITWTARTAAAANRWNSVTYGNGLFVAVAQDGTNRIMTSPDGITWTARTATEANYWRSVTYGNSLFVAVAGDGTNQVMTSECTTPNPTSTITFNVAGGTPSIAPITQEEGTPVTAPADPTKAGYTFQGWVPAVPSTMPVDDVTCVAQWIAITYSVTYNANSGSGNVPVDASSPYAAAATVTVKGNVGTPTILTRTGYAFSGWNTLANGTGTTYQAAATFSMPASAVTLYARWLPTSTITFDLAGGTPAISPITQEEGTPVTAPADPTKAGYTFQGWVPSVPATMPVDDMTCVAQWGAMTYPVTYNANGGSGNVPVDASSPYAAAATVTVKGNVGTPAILTKTGYAFGGWNTLANGTGTTYQAAATFSMPASAVILYARWLPTSTITFDVAGGTPSIAPITQEEGTPVTAPANPTKAGYTFQGWVPAVPATMPVDDMTCVAQWTAASTCGVLWTARTAAAAKTWASVTYGNGLFVAVAVDESGGTNTVMTSPDGINWTARTAANANWWYSVTYGNGLFVAVAVTGSVMTSPDGITWTARTAAAANSWYSVTYGNGLFVAVAESGTNSVMTSPDGITWTARTAAAASNWYSVTYGNGLFVAVAGNATNSVMTSPDGITWTARTAAAANFWSSVTSGNGLFVAVANNGTNRVMTSPDGITWTARTAAAANSWTSVTYGNSLFVAVASSGTNRVMTSPDGITWTTPTATEPSSWNSVTYGNSLFVAVAYNGTNRVMTSDCSTPNPTSTITFNVAGGTPTIAPITQEEGTPVTAPADPTKAGYIFQGWVPAVPSTMPVDDMTCVAQWGTMSYALTYNANGGSGNVPVDASSPYAAAATVTVKGNIGTPAILTRTGYAFSGWNTLANGSGTTYTAGATFSMPASAVTLYARWLPTTTITFDVSGGTPAISPITQEEGTPVTAPADPTKAGYTFQGWVPSVPATMPVDDMTCVAQWQLNCVNPANGGTIANNQTGCSPFDPVLLTNSASPTGQTGTLEYKWQAWYTHGNLE